MSCSARFEGLGDLWVVMQPESCSVVCWLEAVFAKMRPLIVCQRTEPPVYIAEVSFSSSHVGKHLVGGEVVADALQGALWNDWPDIVDYHAADWALFDRP